MDNSTLCYIEKDDSYLMMHRVKKKNDLNHDKWIGIGGHFEFGESPYDCVIREAFEETGVTLVNPGYRGIVTFVSDKTYTEQMHLFTCTDYEGELNLACNEGDLEWVRKSEIKGLPIWEGDKIFLDLLDRKVPFFSLKLVYENDRLTEVVLDGKRFWIADRSFALQGANDNFRRVIDPDRNKAVAQAPADDSCAFSEIMNPFGVFRE